MSAKPYSAEELTRVARDAENVIGLADVHSRHTDEYEWALEVRRWLATVDALQAKLEQARKALKECDALMIRPAHIFTCGAYGDPSSDATGVHYPLTGKCTCGVDAAHERALAATLASNPEGT